MCIRFKHEIRFNSIQYASSYIQQVSTDQGVLQFSKYTIIYHLKSNVNNVSSLFTTSYTFTVTVSAKHVIIYLLLVISYETSIIDNNKSDTVKFCLLKQLCWIICLFFFYS